MRLKLPPSLHYPITVTELLKQPKDDVQRSEPLFSYFYKTKREITNRDGEVSTVDENFPTRFESSVDGTLQIWFLKKGMVINKSGGDVVEIDEPCEHSVQYGGMCVNCGKDMTELTYATAQVDANRANIRMIHDNTALTVSAAEATRAEEEGKRRLITSKKLSLVVDLDQTIIHATVDPTVAEWQKDPNNPNFQALQDVKAFQLVDDGPGGRGTWYYIKLRPGLPEFLERVSKIYELHIYTMGTRAYAQHIAELVDPTRKIFGDRILSRDESGSMVAKNLQRLFPVDTNMVVVIDDRGDVWNWNPNLIKVTQFSFFIGIGDINSSFLPKRQPKIRSAPKSSTTESNQSPPQQNRPVGGPSLADSDSIPQNPSETQQPNGKPAFPSPDASAEIPASALEQLVAMSSASSNPATLEEQSAKQDEALNAQLQDRPLAQMQQKLDASDSSPDDESESDSDHSQRPRHHLLNNTDNELHYLEAALRKVHTEFFAAYASRMASAKGGRLAELRGGVTANKKAGASANTDLTLVPDIKDIMPTLKRRTLQGVNLVFSGVIPLDAEVHSAEIAVWARSFGAKIQDRVSGRTTTHVVAARNRTAKVRQAVRRGKGKIKIVGPAWLMDCIVQWTRLHETPYLLKTDESDIGRPFPGELEEDDMMSESEDDEDEEEERESSLNATDTETEAGAETDNMPQRPLGPDGNPIRQRLKLNIKPPPTPSHIVQKSGPNGTHRKHANGLYVPSSTAADAPALADGDDENSDLESSEDGEEGVVPAAEEEAKLEADLSPVGGTNEDWKSMHDEMAEFLGSDAEDEESEAESLQSLNSSQESIRKSREKGSGALKRGREEESDDGGDGEEGDKGFSAGGVRKKVRSQLAVEVPVEDGPDDEEDEENNGDQDGEDEEDGDGWSQLGDDLEREMEEAMNEQAADEEKEKDGDGDDTADGDGGKSG